MGHHLPAPGAGLSLGMGIGIELGKELSYGKQTQSHHEGLVPIIAGAKISRSEDPGHGHLGRLLAVPEDPEFCFTGEDLPATQEAGLAAPEGQSIVPEHTLRGKIQL
jgi:hypothetical protein